MRGSSERDLGVVTLPVDPENAAVIPPDPQLAYTLGAIHARLGSLEQGLDRLRQDLAAQRRAKTRAEDAQELLAVKSNGKTIYRTGDVVH